ncbi:YolD-like family protein [Salisediminibacterium selenitireducens]|uniref:YolD-like protein n=1 Tax=Bacillus selenitireducens (strain ATCC 700615 / DSM 15326 / MLS10) TaxID=439292 RepID=D6XUN7_BACIE|nr:YolD-like family protein [Salisediminibacterium selenitireducens]ADH99523.1 YolD-like protein [[Bacillus] selenitireducens MLS10]
MNRDRGMKKWTQMMLPEHKQLLHELNQKEAFKPMPDLDPQEQEEMAHKILLAFHKRNPVTLSIWKDGSIHRVTGVLVQLQHETKHVQLDNGQSYPVNVITGVDPA